jgi:hypothetical protein
MISNSVDTRSSSDYGYDYGYECKRKDDRDDRSKRRRDDDGYRDKRRK